MRVVDAPRHAIRGTTSRWRQTGAATAATRLRMWKALQCEFRTGAQHPRGAQKCAPGAKPAWWPPSPIRSPWPCGCGGCDVQWHVLQECRHVLLCRDARVEWLYLARRLWVRWAFLGRTAWVKPLRLRLTIDIREPHLQRPSCGHVLEQHGCIIC